MSDKKKNVQQIVAAINRHDMESLRKLLAQGAHPNAHILDDYHGETPVLLSAAGAQFLEGVRILLDAGADPNAFMSGGRGARGGATPLHFAIIGCGEGPGSYVKHTREDFLQNRLKIVDLLLKAGADPNAVAKGDTLPLAEAASGGHYEIVQRLIDAGATFKTWPSGCTPPLVAAAGGVAPHGVEEGRRQERVVKLLLNLGAPVDGETANGVTALMATAVVGSERTINLLLEHGADVNHRSKDGRTPLICAALYAQDTLAEDEHELALQVIKQLLDAGADPTAKNDKGETAYDVASRSEGQLAAEYLKKLSSPSSLTRRRK